MKKKGLKVNVDKIKVVVEGEESSLYEIMLDAESRMTFLLYYNDLVLGDESEESLKRLVEA